MHTRCSSRSTSPKIQIAVARSSAVGRPGTRGVVSGESRVVDLGGTAMTRLLGAIPVIAEQTGRAVVLIGGLLVAALKG